MLIIHKLILCLLLYDSLTLCMLLALLSIRGKYMYLHFYIIYKECVIKTIFIMIIEVIEPTNS